MKISFVLDINNSKWCIIVVGIIYEDGETVGNSEYCI